MRFIAISSFHTNTSGNLTAPASWCERLKLSGVALHQTRERFFRFTARKWTVNLKLLSQLEPDLDSCHFSFEVKHSSDHLSAVSAFLSGCHRCDSIWYPNQSQTCSSITNVSLRFWTKLSSFSKSFCLPRGKNFLQERCSEIFQQAIPPTHKAGIFLLRNVPLSAVIQCQEVKGHWPLRGRSLNPSLRGSIHLLWLYYYHIGITCCSFQASNLTF